MREIKFRAWDTSELEMFDPLTHHSESFSEILSRPGEYVVMQYTGLKDKNGKEIYEGDILKHDLWKPDVVVWDDECANFRGKNDERDVCLSHHQLSRSKVIGNIHENPELIKGEA